eukprot:2837634-Lingulodinium_polyedra.AAC.1
MGLSLSHGVPRYRADASGVNAGWAPRWRCLLIASRPAPMRSPRRFRGTAARVPRRCQNWLLSAGRGPR